MIVSQIRSENKVCKSPLISLDQIVVMDNGLRDCLRRKSKQLKQKQQNYQWGELFFTRDVQEILSALSPFLSKMEILKFLQTVIKTPLVLLSVTAKETTS